MCFSSTVMFGLHDQIAEVGERHAVDSSLDRAVRLLLLDAVNELRALVRSGDREDLLSLIASAERSGDSRSGQEFDALLGIFAGYELEESDDARRQSGT